jgi:hypothetical protein
LVQKDTGNRSQVSQPAVEAGRTRSSDPGASISTPANSETLRSTPNRAQERSNYQPALHRFKWSRCQPGYRWKVELEAQPACDASHILLGLITPILWLLIQGGVFANDWEANEGLRRPLMKRIRLGANFTVFLLFFGVATLEAFQTRNWLKAGFWLAIGIAFLAADSLNKRHLHD